MGSLEIKIIAYRASAEMGGTDTSRFPQVLRKRADLGTHHRHVAVARPLMSCPKPDRCSWKPHKKKLVFSCVGPAVAHRLPPVDRY